MSDPYFDHTYAGAGYPLKEQPGPRPPATSMGIPAIGWGAGNPEWSTEPEEIKGSFHLEALIEEGDPLAQYTDPFAILVGEGDKQWFIRDLDALEKVL